MLQFTDINCHCRFKLPSICSIKSGLVLRNASIAVTLEAQGYNIVTMNKTFNQFNFNIFKNNPQHSISIKFENLIEESATEFSKQSNMSGELLSIEEIKLNLDIGLVDYGADSLFIAQLKNWIDKEIGINLVTILQIQSNTINSLIQFIKKKKQRNKNIVL
ncbi:hypothetical protein ACTFIT_002706 [Dictyostelium discoideum]